MEHFIEGSKLSVSPAHFIHNIPVQQKLNLVRLDYITSVRSAPESPSGPLLL